MNVRTHPPLLLSALAVAVAIAVMSCTSTSKLPAEEAASSLQTVEADLALTMEQVDAVEASLNELIRPDQPDVRNAFAEYSERVDELENLGERLIENTNQMNRKGLEYFDEWEKQADSYTNPEIREISEQRRMELQEIYSDISRANSGVDESLTAYMSNVRDIQTFLSNDLTPKGIEAISSLVAQFQTDGRNLHRALARVQTSVDRAGAAMAHGDTGQD